MVADPLHRLDCCVITDGGGAVVVVSPEVARSLARPDRCVDVLGHGEAVKHTANGRIDLTHTPAVWSGPRAFAEAGVRPADIKYASIYDSFTITVLETIEDLGFCEKGQGGAFAASGALEAPFGALPFNTDGGGLCNNHPANRGGMTKIIEAVRLTRDEVYILNVLKCRPPENRTPLPEEVANCRGFFERQLEIIRPEFICCLGTSAAHALLQTTEPIGKLRGRWFTHGPSQVICTYHPSYLLRNPAAKRPVWDDMQALAARAGIDLSSG